MNKVSWLFDLDNTLYSADSGMFDYLNSRINLFVSDKLKIELPIVKKLRRRYIKEYCSTLIGLKEEYAIDPSEYLLYVHNIEVSNFLRKEEKLKDFIDNLPGEKIVVTNSPLFYAEEVLKVLGIWELFSEIYDIEFMDYFGKPYLLSIKKVIDKSKINVSNAIFIDDSFENIISAKYLGFKTLLISKDNNYKDYYEDILFPKIRGVQFL